MKPFQCGSLSACCLALIFVFLQVLPSLAGQQITAEQLRFFESKIRPVLVRECYSCHSSQVGQVRGGLWLDTAEAARSGGDSGPAIVPGNLEDSLLWNALNHLDFQMPPRRRLSEEVLADFQTWIEMGAPDPRTSEDVFVRSGISDDDLQKGRQFWSFQPPTRPEIPDTPSDWPVTPIDRFILEKLTAQAIDPAKDAAPEVVLRRLCFDLIGLPPTPDQLTRFVSDWRRNPQVAVSQMTEWLLDQPQFGERWGRHWLDVARYAESTGREVNMTFPTAWRYRDYVIRAFNDDKPYDRFLQEQIAGDLLPIQSDEEWAENLIATGFLAIGPKALVERNPRQFELDLVDEQIDVTTRVMLGVSVACARCHDHKFEPIPQVDYYALSGIFRSMSTHYGTSQTLQNRRASNLIELPVADERPLQSPITARQLKELKSELSQKQRELNEALAARRKRQTLASKITSESAADSNRLPQARVLPAAQLSAAVGSLQALIDSYDETGQPLSLCMGVQESRPVKSQVLERGEFNRPGQEVPRGFPQVLCHQPVTIDSQSTGRLEFARWVGSSKNPLAARVMVNRVWLHLFGSGIVRTPEDFGSTGSPPTHPELLDYLAVEFMESGWSVKQLIRQIVNSRAYRMSSQFDEACFEKDPENLLIWRRDPKRLEAEAIRDAMLFISGEIDLKPPRGSMVALSGATVVRDGRLFTAFPNPADQIPANTNRQLRSTSDVQSTPSVQILDQPASYRSVYLPIVRDSIPRSLDVFDFAEASMVIGQRETSNTPDQGLYFLNNQFVLQQSLAMARSLRSQLEEPRRQVEEAFRRAYSRKPSPSELRAVLDFYRGFQPEHVPNVGTRRTRAVEYPSELALAKLSAICQSLMAAAEFRYLD